MARKSRKSSYTLDSNLPLAPNLEIYNTALYVRISVENDQKIEADSIGTQIQMLKDFASQIPNLKVCDVYSDDDISGTDFVRPSFLRLMEDIKNRKINCVIVKDLSRLGRNMIESGEYLEKVFPFLGVRFISINDNIDTLERPVDIDAQIKNLVNEMYAKDSSKKICSTMKTLQKQGKFISGHPPYGYIRNPEDKYALLIDPEAASIVKEIYKLFAGGRTIHAITNDLNMRGIPSPGRHKFDKGIVKNEKFKNSVWFHITVRRILSDRVYLGWIVSGQKESQFYKGGAKSVAVPEQDWIITKGTHEAVIEENEFNKVQELLSKRAEKLFNVGNYNSKGNIDNLLRGILRCGECGKSMTFREKRNHGKIQKLYICPMHEHYNSSYCSKKAIKKEMLEKMLLKIIQKQMKLFTDAKDLIQNLNQKPIYAKKYNVFTGHIRKIKREIEEYSAKKADLYNDYAEGILKAKDYTLILEDYKNKMEDMKILLSELEKEALKYAPSKTGHIRQERWIQLIGQYQQATELTGDMAAAFLEKVILFNDGRVEIKLKYQDEFDETLFYASIRRREDIEYAV